MATFVSELRQIQIKMPPFDCLRYFLTEEMLDLIAMESSQYPRHLFNLDSPPRGAHHLNAQPTEGSPSKAVYF